MIKVHNILDIQEIDGKKPEQESKMQVVSHDKLEAHIVIQIGDKALTLLASDLITAIDNATNTNRFA